MSRVLGPWRGAFSCQHPNLPRDTTLVGRVDSSVVGLGCGAFHSVETPAGRVTFVLYLPEVGFDLYNLHLIGENGEFACTRTEAGGMCSGPNGETFLF